MGIWYFDLPSAPEDELIIVAARPDWVGEAYWITDDENTQRWFWANSNSAIIHEVIAWSYLPDFPAENTFLKS